MIVDLATVTSADVRELLSLVEAREAEGICKSGVSGSPGPNELLIKPTIGAYRRHTRRYNPRVSTCEGGTLDHPDWHWHVQTRQFAILAREGSDGS